MGFKRKTPKKSAEKTPKKSDGAMPGEKDSSWVNTTAGKVTIAVGVVLLVAVIALSAALGVVVAQKKGLSGENDDLNDANSGLLDAWKAEGGRWAWNIQNGLASMEAFEAWRSQLPADVQIAVGAGFSENWEVKIPEQELPGIEIPGEDLENGNTQQPPVDDPTQEPEEPQNPSVEIEGSEDSSTNVGGTSGNQGGPINVPTASVSGDFEIDVEGIKFFVDEAGVIDYVGVPTGNSEVVIDVVDGKCDFSEIYGENGLPLVSTAGVVIDSASQAQIQAAVDKAKQMMQTENGENKGTGNAVEDGETSTRFN